MIAKFLSLTDTYPVVQAEFVATELARRAGLNVAAVEMTTASNRHALLIKRFDRTPASHRRRLVSARTILGLTSFPEGRYGTYTDLTHRIRRQFANPEGTLRELFGRISFNILCGNTDDHGRNHAAFVGDELELTPAYDICPQARSGETAEQAMAFDEHGNRDTEPPCSSTPHASTSLIAARHRTSSTHKRQPSATIGERSAIQPGSLN